MKNYDTIMNHFAEKLDEATTIQQLVAMYLMYLYKIPTYSMAAGKYNDVPRYMIAGIVVPAVDVMSIEHLNDIKGVKLYEIKGKDSWFDKYGEWVTGFDRRQYEEYIKYSDYIIEQMYIVFWHSASESKYGTCDEPYPGPGLWYGKFSDMIGEYTSHDPVNARDNNDQIYVWYQRQLKKLVDAKTFVRIIDELLHKGKDVL